jgi:hypothetical protein
MAKLLHSATAGNMTTMGVINRAFADAQTTAPVPQLTLHEGDAKPRITLFARSLIGLMRMEAAMIVTNDVRLAKCENDGVLFLTGPLTGRRSHAKFCSDRCRVAAMRRRQATDGE